jgi:hypothetical protein
MEAVIFTLRSIWPFGRSVWPWCVRSRVEQIRHAHCSEKNNKLICRFSRVHAWRFRKLSELPPTSFNGWEHQNCSKWCSRKETQLFFKECKELNGYIGRQYQSLHTSNIHLVKIAYLFGLFHHLFFRKQKTYKNSTKMKRDLFSYVLR